MKEYTVASFSLSKETIQKINNIKEEWGIPKNVLIEKAIDLYVKEKHLLENCHE